MLNTSITLSETTSPVTSGSEINTKESNSNGVSLPFQTVMAQMQSFAKAGTGEKAATDGLNPFAPVSDSTDSMRQESATTTSGSEEAKPDGQVAPQLLHMVPALINPLATINAQTPQTSDLSSLDSPESDTSLQPPPSDKQMPQVLPMAVSLANTLPTGRSPSSPPGDLNLTDLPNLGMGTLQTGMTLNAAELKLKQTPLGRQMTLITSSQPLPDETSLSEFAQQQGLDLQTIRWLLSSAPSQPAKAIGASGVMAPAELPSATSPMANLPAIATTLSTYNSANSTASSDAPSSIATAQPVWGILNVSHLIHATGTQPMPGHASRAIPHLEVDLTQDTAIDWSAWIRNMASSRLLNSNPSSPQDLNGGIHFSEHLALEQGLDALNPEGWGQEGASNPPPQALNTMKDFRSELGKTQGQDPLLGRDTPTTGQDLADKMSLAIGKRLLESIEKGDWQVKINLKPVELGHIEVDLRMKDNALEARFSSQQGITRDLLESGLVRLKETLQHSGMDVASLRVSDGQSSRNGGDSTPRHAPSGSQDAKNQRDMSPEPEVMASAQLRTPTEGGLDLMV